MADIRVSWLSFDTDPTDVKVSWIEHDTTATPVDVKVSWLEFDTEAGIGRRFKHRAKAYLRRENEILVFQSEEDKETFLEAEQQAKNAVNRAAKRAVMARVQRPAKVDLAHVAREAERLRLESIAALIERQDFELITAINEVIWQMLDEEDIEMLLLA